MEKALADFLAKMEDLPDFLDRSPVTVFTTSPLGDTPLHIAAIRGDTKIARLLIEAGADLNAQGEDGCTPLHEACGQGKRDVVELLLQFGADPSICDRNDETPLDVAEMFEYEEIVELLKYPPRL